MPVISHSPLISPHAAIEELLIITELLSDVSESQLVTKTQSEVVEPTAEPQPESIACQSETAGGKAAHDSNAGDSNMESVGEIEKGDKAKDKADTLRDASTMEGDMQKHDELKKLIACHQKLL